jgi:hypothetical protein
MKTPRVNSIWKWKPVGMDIYDGHFTLLVGTEVRVIQPYGCPKNGTMGHCYIETKSGQFLGLVCINSLEK